MVCVCDVCVYACVCGWLCRMPGIGKKPDQVGWVGGDVVIGKAVNQSINQYWGSLVPLLYPSFCAFTLLLLYLFLFL